MSSCVRFIMLPDLFKEYYMSSGEVGCYIVRVYLPALCNPLQWENTNKTLCQW